MDDTLLSFKNPAKRTKMTSQQVISNSQDINTSNPLIIDNTPEGITKNDELQEPLVNKRQTEAAQTYDNFFNFEDENGQTLLDFMNDRNDDFGVEKQGKVQISRMKTEVLNKVYRKMNLDH